MARKALLVALGMIAAASTAATASQNRDSARPAPAGTPDTKYCMRVQVTGSQVEPVRCWTRDQWASEDVDVDKEWAKNGVAVIG